MTVDIVMVILLPVLMAYSFEYEKKVALLKQDGTRMERQG